MTLTHILVQQLDIFLYFWARFSVWHRQEETVKPGCRYHLCSSELLVRGACFQNQCFANCTLETTSHHPSRRRKKHRKLFKSKTQQPRGTRELTRTPKLEAKHPKQSSPTSPSLTMFLTIQTVPTPANHVMAERFVQVGEEKTYSFMVSWALTLWGSPIQLCKSFSKQPATLLSR